MQTQTKKFKRTVQEKVHVKDPVHFKLTAPDLNKNYLNNLDLVTKIQPDRSDDPRPKWNQFDGKLATLTIKGL
ncbi:hypothetical protein H7100_02585 [Candidatus Saccharibacteria bacterium]|nr:hypothetical protein [Candidatus Saccharibacteria bacterium]